VNEALLGTLILIGILGVGTQWLAWRIRVPSILLLIVVGFLAGPLFGWIQPSRDIGELLQPVVSLGVALILFDGGLNLRLSEYREAGVQVTRLVTAGLLITWVLTAAAAHYVGGLSVPVAVVFGAIMTVTGPTVVAPLLRHARIRRRTAAVLKWEGIVNDPIGVLLAVLAFEYYALTRASPELGATIDQLALAVLSALAIGGVAAYVLSRLFREGGVPEFLKAPLLLVMVFGVYGATNRIQDEAGLLASTAMGLVLANQHLPDIEELRRFTENLAVLFLSGIFILLTADLDMEVLAHLDWRSLALIASIVFVIRPVAVYLATLRSGMEGRERALVGWIAPRGIVAAAMAGVVAPFLAEYAGAEQLVPLVFGVVVVTVTLHGLSIRWLAQRLGVGADRPHGVLILGASPWSVELARVLQELDVPVVVSDVSWHHLRAARMAGIRVHHGQVLSERAEEALELHELSHLLALTANEAYNSLVCAHFAPLFGRGRVFQLAPDRNQGADTVAPSARGNIAFDGSIGYDGFARRYYGGWRFNKARLTDEYGVREYQADRGDEVLLLRLSAQGRLQVYPIPERDTPKPGDVLVSFGPERPDENVDVRQSAAPETDALSR